ncbi:MAG: insulinase family protein [Melioribacteraceae bacterium]|nr:insulinase family protein [Melioribacteraceae bacterium]
MAKDILKINYEKYNLSNGLEVILYPDKSQPLAAVNIWYKVGSANEKKNKTGFAHLFEHMMFQGSENVPKEGHFRYIQEAGGNLNGSTSIDRTNYYETLPANSLELALWLESDRMGFMLGGLTQEKLDNQKGVVMNERRQRYDNQPYGRAWELLFSNLFPEDHPYHWPTIGWMKDIESFELNEVRSFFQTYYSPNNSSLVIAGNFELEKVKILVEKYFGEFSAAQVPQQPTTPGFLLDKVKQITHEDNVQLSRIYFVWKGVKAYDKSDAALDVLAYILSSTKNSRLHKSLVFDKQIAHDVSAFNYSAKLDGSFIIYSTAKPQTKLDTIREEIFILINEIAEKGISDDELVRAKNSLRSSFIYSLQKIDTIADQLNHYNFYLGEPDSLIFDLSRYENVTVEQIKNAAKEFLANKYVELKIIPKNSANDK